MPQVRMRTTYAGPDGRTAGAGDRVTVSAEEADRLVRGGYATPVEREAPVETATADAGEQAVSRLEDLTKDQLYEMADARDVSGRSSMTKAQLVEVLSEGDEEDDE